MLAAAKVAWSGTVKAALMDVVLVDQMVELWVVVLVDGLVGK